MLQTTGKTNYNSSTALDKCFWTKQLLKPKRSSSQSCSSMMQATQVKEQIKCSTYPSPSISSHKLNYMF